MSGFSFDAILRLLHEGDLLRCFRDSGSVTYVSTLPAPSPSAPCISSFVQSLCTFKSNVREWHFVQHSHFIVGPFPFSILYYPIFREKLIIPYLC